MEDYITGLKAFLYLQARSDLVGYNAQSRATVEAKTVRNYIGAGLPKFGPYLQQRLKLRSEESKKNKNNLPEYKAPERAPIPSSVPTLSEMLGRALPNIGRYTELNNKEQVVAMVDEEMCINCGKCYMTWYTTSLSPLPPPSPLPTLNSHSQQ